MSERVKPLSVSKAKARVRESLLGHEGPVTIADAAARTGLALRDAHTGLVGLADEYPSRLAATSEGELLFSFPGGLETPRREKTPAAKALAALARVAKGVGRFVLRTWIAVVLIGYAVGFLVILLALALKSDDEFGVGRLIWLVLRVLAEALWWTVHPFSPFYVEAGPGSAVEEEAEEREPSFYEQVNRFVFGPPPPPTEGRALEQRFIAHVRKHQGVVGKVELATALELDPAVVDARLARFMLDYDGTVEVSDEGGIVYRFDSLRMQVDCAGRAPPAPEPDPEEAEIPPLTGNELGTDVLIAALNVFTLLGGWFSWSANLTLAKLPELFSAVPLQALPYDGVPWVLGVIPVVFSSALFAVPLRRFLGRPARRKAARGRRTRHRLLRYLRDRFSRASAPPTAEVSSSSERSSVDEAIDERELLAVVRPVGAKKSDLEAALLELDAQGELTDDGRIRYRFVDLETEVRALQQARESAQAVDVGEVFFDSHDPSIRPVDAGGRPIDE